MSTETGNWEAVRRVRKGAKGLKGEAFTLLEGMAHLCDENMVCDHGPKVIAEEGRVGETSIRKLADRLQSLGFLEVFGGGPGQGNHKKYRVFPEGQEARNLAGGYVSENETLPPARFEAMKPSCETPLTARFQKSHIETGARARLEGEDLLHKSSLDGWKVIEPVSSSAIQPTQEKISIQNFEITEDQKLVTDAICEVTGRNRNDLSPRDFDGLVSSLLKIEQSESGATGAERAEQVRRRFTAPNFDLPNPPSPEQVGRWWDRSGVKLKHRETLKANPSATQYGGRGQPKNEEEAQFMRELEQHRAQFNGARSGQMPR